MNESIKKILEDIVKLDEYGKLISKINPEGTKSFTIKYLRKEKYKLIRELEAITEQELNKIEDENKNKKK